MATAPRTTSSLSISNRLFESLATKNYHELIQLYGHVAIQSLEGYENLQQWQTSAYRHGHNRSEREEKMDEFYIPGAGYASSPRDIGGSPASSLFDSGRDSGPASNSSSSSSLSAYATLLREFTAFLHHPELQPSQQSPLPCLDAADRVVRDAVAALTDTQPPADFVLFANGAIVRDNPSMEGVPDLNRVVVDDADLMEATSEEPEPVGPPIFDGSVANATPVAVTAAAAAGPGGIGGGGGAGTALHAVAALDHPLTLALLLAMGANVRATHTAFRRLVQHEAACNGSIQCLSLLLELGHEYGNEQLRTAAQAPASRLPQRSLGGIGENNNPRSPDAASDFPFFPRQSLEDSAFGEFHWHAANPSSSSLRRKPQVTFVPVDQQPKTDVLSLLRLFYSLSQQAESQSISELDAARKLMQFATLTKENKEALISQCGLHSRQTATVQTHNVPPFFLNSISNTSSDGHGNTPLHWASFKNEVACVSLLLKYQADPDSRAQPSGWTPLHDAAYSNGRDAIDLLISAGAAVDARANSGATPLCFAAQEDAAEAAELLLIRGADLTTRCAVGPVPLTSMADGTNQNDPADAPLAPTPGQSRFSGYTPLHYCAHYNAHKAARVLLQHHTAVAAMEIHDLNQRLPIHVAVARGSSDVLRELLRAGARVETRTLNRSHSNSSTPRSSPSRYALSSRRPHQSASGAASLVDDALVTPPRRRNPASDAQVEPPRSSNGLRTPPRLRRSGRSGSGSSTPVSSPLLRSMIPSQPIQSSKPWNCLSQRSIDECRQLISEVELNWTPDRHSLFTPVDRRAVAELLRVGKRLESEGVLSFIYLWPEVLSFCGRGWFDVDEDDTEATDMDPMDGTTSGSEDNPHLALPTFC